MKIACLSVSLGFLFISISFSNPFADSIISYQPGNLPASQANYTNATTVLGEPSRTIPGPFGGPVDPFNPPYLNSQVVAIGTNGSLVIEFNQPILNNPAHPFGLDFIIFGNSGFVITNGDFSGGGITDGSTFGHNPGSTRVSVSADNLLWQELNPSLSPRVDGLHPTDGAGSFDIPVNPALGNADFAGKNLNEIRALYQGSAGGSGYDISWAAAPVGSIRFVRVEVLDGVSEIDGFSIVAIPEPSSLWLGTVGIVFLFLRRFAK